MSWKAREDTGAKDFWSVGLPVPVVVVDLGLGSGLEGIEMVRDVELFDEGLENVVDFSAVISFFLDARTEVVEFFISGLSIDKDFPEFHFEGSFREFGVGGEAEEDAGEAGDSKVSAVLDEKLGGEVKSFDFAAGNTGEDVEVASLVEGTSVFSRHLIGFSSAVEIGPFVAIRPKSTDFRPEVRVFGKKGEAFVIEGVPGF